MDGAVEGFQPLRRMLVYVATVALVGSVFVSVTLLAQAPAKGTTQWSAPIDYLAGTLSDLDANSTPGAIRLRTVPDSWGPWFDFIFAPTEVASDWDADSLPSLSVLRIGPYYEMWYSGCRSSVCSIGSATSRDSAYWSRSSDNPLLAANATRWYADLEEPAVLFDGATYRMWFAANGSEGAVLGYASSEDGTAWTLWPSPVVRATPGTWDAEGVGSPAVLADPSGFTLWFSGRSATGVQAIGRATSPDGVHWTEDSANPVLGPEAAWEGAAIKPVQVLANESHYDLYYLGGGPDGLLGHATSSDGRSWERDSANPVFPKLPTRTSAATQISDASIVAAASRSIMWYAHAGYTPGHVVGLAYSPAYAASGTFVSQVLDAGDSKVVWDELAWRVDDPFDTVRVTFAAGDTAVPGPGWRCCAAATAPGEEPIGWSGLRYAQVHVLISGDQEGTTPLVWNLTLKYMRPTFATTAAGQVTLGGLFALSVLSGVGAVWLSPGVRRPKDTRPGGAA